MLICKKCDEVYQLCLILQVSPIEVNEYKVVSRGLLISVPGETEFDKTIENIMRWSTAIKYYRGKASFYIPPYLSETAYIYVCRDKEWSKAEIHVMELTDALIYLEE
ncbi:MAG: hypothetical protein ABWW65_07240 [Thermoprotei archaeon]